VPVTDAGAASDSAGRDRYPDAHFDEGGKAVTALDFADDLCAFIDASPSPFHAVATAADRLTAAGFTELDAAAGWPAQVGSSFVRRGGSLIAFVSPGTIDEGAAFRIAGAHTDSPNLRIKEQPDAGTAGWRQVLANPYGGPLLTSWLDRDLGLSGRVVCRAPDGIAEHLMLIDEPILRVPHLAIHLDRESATSGLRPDPQRHLNPVWGTGSPPHAGQFRSFVADRLGVDAGDVLGFDLMTHVVGASTRIGIDRDMVSASRLDNLCSTHAGVRALIDAAESGSDQVMVLVLFDHEEVGSSSERGAASTWLIQVLERVALTGGRDREGFLRMLASSACASSDMAHATHPNYPDRHEPNHWILPGAGPVLKVNHNLRYATDGRGAALFALACEQAGVPLQRYVHRADLPCGSTIGPITASALGVTTVDIGAPQLGMHSARELMNAEDPEMLARALAAFLAPVA
jgi:aspartyl aminopeptidase